MDFKDSIKQLPKRTVKHKELVHTEEATKHSFVMPFLQALGYDVFNPLEVVPEFVADRGIQKGKKLDYAIVKDGHPLILIECKHWSDNLDPQHSQLFRYFHTTTARLSILTNGFDLNDIRDIQIEKLKKFYKTYFNSDTNASTASKLKYVGQLKSLLYNEFNNPVRHFAKQVYNAGILTQRVMDKFNQLTQKSFQYYINDLITERLKSALHKEEAEQIGNALLETVLEPDNKAVTTEDELDASQIVRSILRQHEPVQKINYSDAQPYFAILFDDNNRKPICRVYSNGGKKHFGLFDGEKNETKKEIGSLDNIFLHVDRLIQSTLTYNPKPVET